MGFYIKVTLSKRQEDDLIVQRSIREYRIEVNQPDFRKLPVVDQVIKNPNVIDFDRFKEKTNKPSDLSRNEILLQGNMFTGDAETESMRDVVISRYRQVQKSSMYLKNNPVVEIKI
ncbi:MAG: hypothetical protein NTX36_14690 [Proteobacteria bacterium]|nr:hypothetical protein [Pseudomonadota bacterium]